jgi:hypothetical protein
MAPEYLYGQMRQVSAKDGTRLSRPTEPSGVPDSGRIVKLFVGQGHGTIRLADGREIYFHRADIKEGTSINDFSVGDVVTFQRLDDRVSGARALGVARRQKRQR